MTQTQWQIDSQASMEFLLRRLQQTLEALRMSAVTYQDQLVGGAQSQTGRPDFERLAERARYLSDLYEEAVTEAHDADEEAKLVTNQ